MRRIISRSGWRKALVLLGAIATILLLYEIREFDSQYAAWQSMVREDGAPPAGSKLRFSATAYCKGQTTASGVNVRTGIAASDPQILPVGSVLNVATGDQRYNGVYTVMDTGPKVQGRILWGTSGQQVDDPLAHNAARVGERVQTESFCCTAINRSQVLALLQCAKQVLL
jgi:3D (Asp-Asp-Asp) domain-containing protein